MKSVALALICVTGACGAPKEVQFAPDTEAFLPIESLSRARSGHEAVSLQDGRVLILGGSSSTDEATAEIFDPANDTFTPTGSMHVARTECAAVVLENGNVLVTGGSSQIGTALVNTAEIYFPGTGTFRQLPPMSRARIGHSATLLNNGTVLIAGGQTVTIQGYVLTSSAEIYHPVEETFAPTDSLRVARNQHTATLLHDGRVLLTGGQTRLDEAINRHADTAELYDPEKGLFSDTGDMKHIRRRHAAARLQDGKVLIAGSGNVVETFDPDTGTFDIAGDLVHVHNWPTVTLLADGTVLDLGSITPATGPALPSFTILGLTDSQLSEVCTTRERSIRLTDFLMVAYWLPGAMTPKTNVHSTLQSCTPQISQADHDLEFCLHFSATSS